MKLLRRSIVMLFATLWLFPVIIACIAIRIRREVVKTRQPHIALGGCGIINLSEWCQAIRLIGMKAETVVWSTPSIYASDTFDRDLHQRYGQWAGILAPYEFVRSLSRSNIVVCGFDGFVLGITPFRSIEIKLIQLAGGKVVACPYGGDAYEYSLVHNISLRHALQMSYPKAARKQDEIRRAIRRNTRQADFVMPGMMGFDGLGRWDVLAPSFLVIDPIKWCPKTDIDHTESLRITHTPNHRGFKGTEFLIEAVELLRNEGYQIELNLLEGLPNEEVRRVLQEDTDVLVEQLLHTGYAMSALEGMATGNVVIANLEDRQIVEPMRRWTFLRHCPIVSASPETIAQVLRDLIFVKSQSQEFEKLRMQSREYVVKWHSPESFGRFFKETCDYLDGRRGSMISFFNPR